MKIDRNQFTLAGLAVIVAVLAYLIYFFVNVSTEPDKEALRVATQANGRIESLINVINSGQLLQLLNAQSQQLQQKNGN